MINSTIICTASGWRTCAFTASHTWRYMLSSANNPGNATSPRSKLLM